MDTIQEKVSVDVRIYFSSCFLNQSSGCSVPCRRTRDVKGLRGHGESLKSTVILVNNLPNKNKLDINIGI